MLLDGTQGKLSIQHTCSCGGRNGSTSSSTKSPKDNIFTSLYCRFSDWIASKRDVISKSRDANSLTCRHRKTNPSRPNGFQADFPDHLPPSPNHLSPVRYGNLSPDYRGCPSPVPSQCSAADDSLHLASSSCSSYTMISTPRSASGAGTPNCHSHGGAAYSPSCSVQAVSPHHLCSTHFRLDYDQIIEKLLTLRTNGHNIINQFDDVVCQQLQASSGQPPPRKRLQSETRQLRRQKSVPLWSTWPLLNNSTGNDNLTCLSAEQTNEIGDSI